MTLPAGRYNATLIADGAPVTATLKLSGLATSRTLRPTTPARADFRKISGETPEQPGHVYSTGGRTYTFGGPALVLDSVAYRTAFGGEFLDGSCYIAGEAPPNNLYGPQCPTLDPSDDPYNAQIRYGTAPEEQTESNRIASMGGIGVTPKKGEPVTLSVGNYVVSATPAGLFGPAAGRRPAPSARLLLTPLRSLACPAAGPAVLHRRLVEDDHAQAPPLDSPPAPPVLAPSPPLRDPAVGAVLLSFSRTADAGAT